MCVRGTLIPNLAKKVNLVLFSEQRRRDRVHWNIIPPLLVQRERRAADCPRRNRASAARFEEIEGGGVGETAPAPNCNVSGVWNAQAEFVRFASVVGEVVHCVVWRDEIRVLGNGFYGRELTVRKRIRGRTAYSDQSVSIFRENSDRQGE